MSTQFKVVAVHEHQGCSKKREFTMPWPHLPRRMEREGWKKVKATRVYVKVEK